MSKPQRQPSPAAVEAHKSPVKTTSNAPSEADPLLGSSTNTRQDGEQHDSEGLKGQDKSLLYLIVLTLALGGLQTAWSVELASITPYLQELGLSKSLLSLVWIAGPLSGTLVQPWVGIQSDDCRSRFGRRRPFMIGGALATTVTLLALAWARDIVGGLFVLFGGVRKSHDAYIATQIFAVVLVYMLDFAINMIQAGIRAFIVDCVPSHQQEKANAVAGVVSGLGGIVGFLAGQTKLTGVLPWLGDTQFKILCVLSCAAMLSTLLVSCLAIREPDPWSFGPPSNDGFGVFAFFKKLYKSVRSLPQQVKTVCIVQIFAWMGWFPFLFYTTTYIGNIYAQHFLEQDTYLSPDEIDDIYERGTRKGTHAMFVFSVTTLAFSTLLPVIVTPTEELQGGPRRGRFPLHIPWLSLKRAWMLGHISYAVLTWLTLLARTTASATALIALAGFPWAMAQWAPFAFIASEISKREEATKSARSDGADDEEQSEEAQEPQAGVVLGIHNVAVAAPQVIATLVSSIIFKLLQKPRGVAGDDSTGWVLRAAGLSALAAAWWTRKVSEGGA